VLSPQPLYTSAENPKVPTSTPLPVFARLHFDAIPASLHDDFVIRRWLMCRGIQTYKTVDKRAALEKLVQRVVELGGLKVFPPSINIQDKKYTGFEILDVCVANNEYDNWNRDYFSLAGRLRHVDDRELNLLFGKGVNGVRKRAELLMDGGNYHIKGMKCRNVKSKDPDYTANLILFSCECLSSQKGDIYQVYLCFEERDGGVFQRCPYLSCPCTDSALFCSHQLGLLLVYSGLQRMNSRTS
jgi:hypothetical protein